MVGFILIHRDQQFLNLVVSVTRSDAIRNVSLVMYAIATIPFANIYILGGILASGAALAHGILIHMLVAMLDWIKNLVHILSEDQVKGLSESLKKSALTFYFTI